MATSMVVLMIAVVSTPVAAEVPVKSCFGGCCVAL
jgi:hypothetical protein